MPKTVTIASAPAKVLDTTPKYIDSAGLLHQYQMGRSTFQRARKLPGFPAPVSSPVFGNKKLWIVAEVDAWFENGLTRCEPSPEPVQLRAARGLPQ